MLRCLLLGVIIVLNGPQRTDATIYTEFLNKSNFTTGFDGWNVEGTFAKNDLLKYEESIRPVPVPEDSKDGHILMCQTGRLPSILQKNFKTTAPLTNATLDFNSYSKFNTGDLLKLTGELIFEETSSELMSWSEEELKNNTWVSTSIPLLKTVTEKGNFMIRFTLTSEKAAVWALLDIAVEGQLAIEEETKLPPVELTTPAPQVNKTEAPKNVTVPANVTTQSNVTIPSNVTEAPKPETTENPVINVNKTEAPNVNVTQPTNTNTTDNENEGEEEEENNNNESNQDSGAEMAGIAKAIWDAFYVFLALFCACLVALIVLIAKGRASNDTPVPAVAAYHPRNSTYNLDKMYDNRSYDHHDV